MFDLFLKGLGAGMQAFGAIEEGQDKADNLNAQATQYDNQAVYETIKGDYDVARKREATHRVIGQQKNMYLGEGLQLTGTPSDVAFDSLTESEKDVFAIKFGAEIRASNYRAEAENRRRGAEDAKDAGRIKALTSLVSFGASGAGSPGGSNATQIGNSLYGLFK